MGFGPGFATAENDNEKALFPVWEYAIGFASYGLCRALNFATYNLLDLWLQACCIAKFFWYAAFATSVRLNVWYFVRTVHTIMNHCLRKCGVFDREYGSSRTYILYLRYKQEGIM